MSIDVPCACGKRLKARDELAGRWPKCPGCGASLHGAESIWGMMGQSIVLV